MWPAMEAMLLGLSFCVDDCIDGGDAQERMIHLLAMMGAAGWTPRKSQALRIARKLVAGECWTLLWERIGYQTGRVKLTAPDLESLEFKLRLHYDGATENGRMALTEKS